MARQVVLDTETTGLKPSDGHRIIEIGCLELENRKLTGRQYHQYINPDREVDPDASAITGLTYEALKGEPLFHEIADEFLDFVGGAELIIHNAPFDLSFINYELSLLNKKIKQLEEIVTIVDTLDMARKLFPGQRNNLDALCKRYNIDNTNRDLHGALIDVELLVKVYLKMTMGQYALDLTENADNINKQIFSSKDIIRPDGFMGVIIQANANELSAHHEFLELIKKHSDKGVCLWES